MSDITLRRHDLVFVSGSAWRSLMTAREDLAAQPWVAAWVERGWPLVARRPLPGERGVALGLPLPPSAGKRRLAMLMRPEDIVSTAPPLTLSVAVAAAPRAWQATLARVAGMGLRHGIKPRAFGSLAWCALTGLDYLTAGSDLDLILPIRRGNDPTRLVAELAAIESDAPMRLDGEVVREDGTAVNWRELHAGAPEVLAKTLHDVKLLPAGQFCCEEAMS
jgi:phosphoribosyl-dephospho-CoA transferase